MRVDCKKWGLAFSAAMILQLPAAFAYPRPIAFIKDYEAVAGYIESIDRANGEDFEEEALLYPEDQVRLKENGVGIVTIEYGPYAKKVEMDARTYRIVQEPPSMFDEISEAVYECVSFFWSGVDRILNKPKRNVEIAVAGITRSQEEASGLNLRPGFKATLLMSQQTCFSWSPEEENTQGVFSEEQDGAQGIFSIQESSGKSLYQNSAGKENSVTLLPREIGMKPGKHYTWTPDGGKRTYKCSVLDRQTETQLLEALAKIDGESIPQDEKLLKKAKYVQLLSDTFPDTVNLYWLSAQWLANIRTAPENIVAEQQILLHKCERHLLREWGDKK